MASITFEGPNPVNPEARSSSVVEMSDEALLASVEAICVNYNYQMLVDNPDYDSSDSESVAKILNPIGPGTFSIQKIIDFCVENTRSYQIRKAQTQANLAVTAALAPLEKITIKEV